MKQNIYDHPDFFAGYQSLRDSEKGMNGTLEVPAIRQVMPNLSGKAVLDVGCGLGHFAAHALSQGTASYVGVDVSEKMIEVAKVRFAGTGAIFINQAVEDFAIETMGFDVIVSSLCLHYVEDYSGFVGKAAKGLKNGGMLVFSVEHPICTALLSGWHRAEDGTKQHWPVDRYKEEGRRVQKWFVDGVVKYHRTIETYVNVLIRNGLTIVSLLEPNAQEEVIKIRPDLKDENRRPPFLIIAAVRP